MSTKPKKTYASEISFGLVLGWVALTVYLFTAIKPDDVLSYEGIYNNLTMVIVPTSLASLGFKRYVENKNNVEFPSGLD